MLVKAPPTHLIGATLHLLGYRVAKNVLHSSIAIKNSAVILIITFSNTNYNNCWLINC